MRLTSAEMPKHLSKCGEILDVAPVAYLSHGSCCSTVEELEAYGSVPNS